MASIKPLQDRVILRRIEEGEQIRGGIIIPDTAKEKPQEGEVIAVGAGKKLDTTLRPGFGPMQRSAELTVWPVVCVAPLTLPSASPSRTIILPK